MDSSEKLIVILLIILGLMILTQVILICRRRFHEKHYYTYLPKFDNDIIEKYYYKVYDVISVNYKTSYGRDRQGLFKRLTVIFLVSFGVFMFMYGSTGYPLCRYLSFGSIACCFISAALIFKSTDALFNEVIPKIVKFINDSFVYYSNMGITYEEYTSIYSKNFDSYYSSDLIKGTIKNCDIRFSEVHTRRAYRDSNDQIKYETIFHGVIAVIDLKNIRSKPDTGNQNDIVIINNSAGDDYDAKILNNKLCVKYEVGSLFDLGYTNEREESLHLARNLYNIDLILETFEKLIDEIITKKL